MFPHPQPLFLHLHHIVFLILWVVDFLQLEEGSEQMLAATRIMCVHHCCQVKNFSKRVLELRNKDQTVGFSKGLSSIFDIQSVEFEEVS